jgi:hypothetical protein
MVFTLRELLVPSRPARPATGLRPVRMPAMADIPPVTGPVHDIRRSYVRVIVVWVLQLLGLFALHVYFS